MKKLLITLSLIAFLFVISCKKAEVKQETSVPVDTVQCDTVQVDTAAVVQ